MAAEKKPAAQTEYLVFKQEMAGDAQHGSWHRVQAVTSASASSAIRACVSKLAAADQAGTFVAVPARSWKPPKVAPKTTVQLELTEVKP